MPGSKILQLNCLLWEKRHTPLIHPIRVGRDQTVSDLIEEICKQEEAFGLSLRRNIELFKCSTIPKSPFDSLASGIKTWNPSKHDIIQPADEISEWFPDVPSRSLVHIVIVATDMLTLNYALAGHDDENPHEIEISRNEKISRLKDIINQAEKLDTPPEALQLWKPAEFIPYSTQQLPSRVREWPKTNAIPLQNEDSLFKIFPRIIPDDVVHIVVKSPSPPEQPKDRLPEHIRVLLTISVPSGIWSEGNLSDNHALLYNAFRGPEIPTGLPIHPHIVSLRSVLMGRREAPLVARQGVLLELLTHDLFHKIYNDLDDNVDERTMRDDFKAKAEFLSFVHLSSVYKYVAKFVGGQESSSAVKEGIFSALFIMPSLLLGLMSGGSDFKFIYKQDQAWSYSILTLFSDTVKARYTPRSDFSLGLTYLIVQLIIAEIVSENNESDRYRMLCQAIVATRVAKYLLKESSDTFVLMAIYVTRNFVAERYLVSQTNSSMEVQIVQDNFDLLDMNQATEFLLSLYNYQQYAHEKANSFDVNRSSNLQTVAAKYIKNSRLESFTRVKNAMNKTTTKNEGKKTGNENLRTVQESGEAIFHSAEVVDQLVQRNCIYQTFVASNVARIRHIPSGSDYILKYIPSNNSEEDILRYLSGLDSDENLENHTVQPIWFWRVSAGTLVLMPLCGVKLGDMLLGPRHDLLSLCRQLIEGVAFMHEHGVAHLDLKPENVLVGAPDGCLSIIDFSVSEKVGSVNDMMKGFVGTTGHTAPEVGRVSFSPILADVWACGHLLKDLCMKYNESWHRDVILGICEELTREDPRQRPRLVEVAARLRRIGGAGSRSPVMPIRRDTSWTEPLPSEIVVS